MTIQTKIYERLLSMAQMHQIGVLQRGPNMLWTCRWNEAGQESSMCYELMENPYDRSLRLRFRYKTLANAKNPDRALDYHVSLRVSRSYKQKTWYWFVCPLIVNGQPCHRRVRNLYFLPNSEYFGCKHCRDMMMRGLMYYEPIEFRQTKSIGGATKRADGGGAHAYKSNLGSGWRPSAARQSCGKCGCLSEGTHCCNCGAAIANSDGSDFFEILGVGQNVSEHDMRVAFTTRIMQYHPDRVAHLGEKLREVAEEEIKHINLAYETLKDPNLREAYLRERGR